MGVASVPPPRPGLARALPAGVVALTRVRRQRSISRKNGRDVAVALVIDAMAAERADHYPIRLTLTAAVAKNAVRDLEDETFEGVALDTDVRHLARALGAPVEVWAPGKHGMVTTTHSGPKLITTVSP